MKLVPQRGVPQIFIVSQLMGEKSECIISKQGSCQQFVARICGCVRGGSTLLEAVCYSLPQDFSVRWISCACSMRLCFKWSPQSLKLNLGPAPQRCPGGLPKGCLWEVREP